MKSFVISIVLAVLMLTAIVGNVLYINKVETRMNRMLDELPSFGSPTCAEAAREMEAYWQKNLQFVVISVNYSTADRVSEHLATLIACTGSGDRFGYYTSIALIRDAVGDMTRMERLDAAI